MTESLYLSTFSIVAYDPDTSEWGVGVQSKFLAVGALVPWARAGAGALATQSRANVSYGPRGLAMMAEGLSAQETLDRLLASDDDREHRQVGLVDAQGNPATFTGAKCPEWAGALMGTNYTVQGNILVSGATVEAMAKSFEDSEGELADRLVASLAAGQKAGGDRRGQQAAALLVVREEGGYGGLDDCYIDLRVDDAPQPIEQLKALLDLHHLYFKSPATDDWMMIEGELCQELQRIVKYAGHYDGPITGYYDERTRRALGALIGMENLEGRFRETEGMIDKEVAALLHKKFGPAGW